MLLKEFTTYFDGLFCSELALEWDNVGLIIGNEEKKIKKILIALDINSNALQEALNLNIDLIISHHPLIFKPIKNIVSSNPIGKIILNLIGNDIAIYSAHTNFDLFKNGISDYVVKLLNLQNLENFMPISEKWFKFAIFVPKEFQEKVREAMCEAGGGKWEDYSCCTFNTEGTGTFKPGESSNPFTGEKGKLSYVDEVKIECIISEKKLPYLLKSVLEVHPYEEPAYDIYPLYNKFESGGIGKLGNLLKPLDEKEFFKFITSKLRLKNFRYICNEKNQGNKILVNKVLLLNGSANSLINEILSTNFDALICGEIDYHNAQILAEKNRLVVEIGHGESELFFVDIVYNMLIKFKKNVNPDLKIFKSEQSCNLWRYFFE